MTWVVPGDGLWYEDIPIGEEMATPAHLVTAGDIARFADVTLDRHPLHVDADYCHARGFPGLIAHGLYGLSLIEGLKSLLHLYDHSSVASLGWESVRFKAPVLAGDTLHARFRFVEKRLSRRGDRGIVTEDCALVNQRKDVVIEARHAGLVLCRQGVGQAPS